MLKKGWQGVKTAKSGVNLVIETFWNVLQPPSSGIISLNDCNPLGLQPVVESNNKQTKQCFNHPFAIY